VKSVDYDSSKAKCCTRDSVSVVTPLFAEDVFSAKDLEFGGFGPRSDFADDGAQRPHLVAFFAR
jgi:hypothetical protein